MAETRQAFGFFVIIATLIIALLIAAALQPLAGRWDAVLFVTALFALLWAVSSKRGWTHHIDLPFVRSDAVSDWFLGLLAMVVALAVSWYAGNAVAGMYSDLAGIFFGLVLFGIIMMAVSSVKEWE
ncbi:MAG: hypothetical protein CVV32_04505 [Methanomicrobiales archaeon HGW-Methanomicrobiales-3]|jgi:hypothetical protein|nr:MAG: hypothetical protein CVV32_04505 [Methanomicrobiales archaeon HGW-Methanomicrobiales-3]